MRMMKRSPNSGRFAEKKRFFVLAALLLLMTAGSLLYITVFGGTGAVPDNLVKLIAQASV